MGETWELMRENLSAKGMYRQDLLGFRKDSALPCAGHCSMGNGAPKEKGVSNSTICAAHFLEFELQEM